MNSNGVPVQLYKKIFCDQLLEINQQILDHIYQLPFEQEKFWNTTPVLEFMQAVPLLRNWLLQNDLPVKSVAITRGLGPNCCGPHTDTPPSRYKLSWPILNTEKTWNRWFRAQPDACVKINSLGGTSYLDPGALIEIDRMQVDQPAIIATGVPHDVWCEPDAKFPRWGLQCQLFNEPQL